VESPVLEDAELLRDQFGRVAGSGHAGDEVSDVVGSSKRSTEARASLTMSSYDVGACSGWAGLWPSDDADLDIESVTDSELWPVVALYPKSTAFEFLGWPTALYGVASSKGGCGRSTADIS
jgi:hypothetical protein